MKHLLLLLVILAVSCDRSHGSGDEPNPANQFVSDEGRDDTKGTEDLGSMDAITEEYMQLLNAYRREKGLDDLIFTKVIEVSATAHSKNMAEKLVPFGHLGSSARCSTIQKSLGGGNLCGEIVAMGQKSALAAFNAWKNSPGHQTIMVNPRYTHTGMGYYKNAAGTYYWTQIFLELK